MSDLQDYYKKNVEEINVEAAKLLSEGFDIKGEANIDKVLCEIEAEYNAFSS
jgi:hypothetical protein